MTSIFRVVSSIHKSTFLTLNDQSKDYLLSTLFFIENFINNYFLGFKKNKFLFKLLKTGLDTDCSGFLINMLRSHSTLGKSLQFSCSLNTILEINTTITLPREQTKVSRVLFYESGISDILILTKILC